ncbi:DNA polymerase III subunit gamma and tau [Glycomyces sp. TRM65418]|uniref:DNA polymerase III subunit gamma and tau n=1 Tax=Glycomyces sp. TRM65418 TaxID=2867006 RepID=UPI001CE66AC1|nr:DNA polymerase III subunit gamma and tau [Glycomyces sp. TRM65418]MCC3763553.1 DNA polymerase III subunit gamma and tau [Glycomyces sp. TRM65418]QZD57536.1 DNA polymerase III subunit gamma and tau [Glycomyces sp. TRM65418]
MALALYRKYRPQTFAEVVGQEHVTEPLINAIRAGRLNHAYLFSGPRGCGKTSSARILARSLNCAQGPTPEPCGECNSCRALAADGHGSVDVIEIDAASHGGVDDARELRERAVFAPVDSRFKIYIIDEAHMVTAAGFNALLKLVEEPPDYVLFIFATTEPDKVLPTIRSRTHHYPFRLIPPPAMRELCRKLCDEEGAVVADDVLPLVVRAGGGSARDTLSVLDQLIAGAGPEGVTYERAAGLLGVTDAGLLDEMCEAFAAADGAAVMEVVERVVEGGHDPRRFAGDLLERLRDLIVLTQVPDAGPAGLVDAPADQLAKMTSQATRMGTSTLTRMAEVIAAGLAGMRGATAPRLLLELACVRAILPGSDESMAGLMQRLETLEQRAAGAAFAAPRDASGPTPTGPAAARTALARATGGTAPSPRPAPAAAETASEPVAPPSVEAVEPVRVATAVEATVEAVAVTAEPTPPWDEEPEAPSASAPAQAPADDWADAEPVPAAAPAPAEGPAAGGGMTAASIRRQWDRIMMAVKDRKRTTAALLQEATIADATDSEVVLAFKHAFHAENLQKEPAYGIVVQVFNEVLGGNWKIRCEVGEAANLPKAGTGAARVPAPSSAAPAQRRAASPPPRQSFPPQAPESFEEPPPEDFDEPSPDDPVAPGGFGTSEEQAVKLLTTAFGAKQIA